MKSSNKKWLLSLFIVLGIFHNDVLPAGDKKLQPIEECVVKYAAFVGVKCQQPELGKRMKEIMDSLVEWGRLFVDKKVVWSKSTFLIRLKVQIDNLFGVIQELQNISKQVSDKDLKKSYAQTLSILRAFHKNLTSVYALIQGYNDSTNELVLTAFGVQLKPYQPLLPKELTTMKREAVIDALRHRFSCKDLA